MVGDGELCEPAALSAGAFLRDLISTTGRKGKFAFVCVLGGAILEGVGFSLFFPLLALIFKSGFAEGWLGAAASRAFTTVGADTPAAKLATLLGTFGLLMAARALVFAARDIAIFDTQLAFIEAQRLRIATNLVSARWDCISRLHNSRITSLMSGEIQRLGIGIELLLRGCSAAAILFAQISLAFVLSPPLAVIIVLVLIAGTVALHPLLTQARVLGGHVTDANQALVGSTMQFLSGLKLALSQNLEVYFFKETRETLHRLGARQSQFIRRQVRSQGALAALSALTGAGLLFAGFVWLHISPPVLITLLLIVTRMIAPTGQIYKGAQQLAQVLAIYDRVGALNHELVAAARDRVAKLPAFPCPDGEIVFENVWFQHPGSGAERMPDHSYKGRLNFNLAIAPGEFLGITGPSGVGKTTFADLLVGLHVPQTGCITVGGRKLEGAALAAWRDTLSYVSQDQFVFHDTVRRNLAWVGPDVDEQALWEALALTGADEVVRRMDNGLDTVLGERGALISGGERQRIALARALLRRPRLLILDEATAAIDADGEFAIFSRIRAMRQRPTVITIAHRTENLSVCDRVLRFETIGIDAGRNRLHREAAALARSR